MRKLRKWRADLSAAAVFTVTWLILTAFWGMEAALLRQGYPDAASWWGLLMLPVYLVMGWLNLGRHTYSTRVENLRTASEELLAATFIGAEHLDESEGRVTVPTAKVRAMVLAAQAVTDRRDG